MTFDIALILLILAAALVLFVTEVIRMDLVALLVLAALALTGLSSPTQVLSGFSNPAVITVWAMFILSEGLTRTGIANLLGRQVMNIAGHKEASLIIVIMLVCGGLSFFMNNIGVAALMLPVVIDICRRTGVSPSRLLMPMAFGTLLGGLTTLFGTPPNLLISAALADHGYTPFGLFDYTPVGIGALAAGTLFIALLGRNFLPQANRTTETLQHSQRNLRTRYGLQERSFSLRVPNDSILIGNSIADSRISSVAGMVVMALERNGQVDTLPPRTSILKGGDELLVYGRRDRFDDMRSWSDLIVERGAPKLHELIAQRTRLIEVIIADSASLTMSTVGDVGFRRHFGADVLTITHNKTMRRDNLSRAPLRGNDRLLLRGSEESVTKLESSPEFSRVLAISEEDLDGDYRWQDYTFVARVPRESDLGGKSLADSRLAEAFDFHVMAIFRDGHLQLMPELDDIIHGGDQLLIQGRPEDLDVLRGLQELETDTVTSPNLNVFEDDRLVAVESILTPRSVLAGVLVNDIDFRKKYGLELGAIRRAGKVILENLEQQKLQPGDAFVLIGPRQRLAMLNDDANLLLLTPVVFTAINTRRAPVAVAILVGVVVSVLAGWMPISIAAVAGASMMVLSGCLNMDQAYQAIDWRAVFLIAGMLPLGIAMQDSGTAEYLTGMAMRTVGSSSPWVVIAGLYAVTALGTMIIPTAALVVLMSPVVMSVSLEMGFAPHTAMMAVAMAASASFTSPISHPANILIMGPGGYRFSDYIKLGGPLTLIVFVVVMILLPVFWPLQPV